MTPSGEGQGGPRILVIRCGAVGDTVMATCVLEPILARYPDAQIEWLATPGSASLFKSDPRIQRLHLLKHRKLPIWLTPAKRELVRSSRARPFDWVINLETATYLRPFVAALKAKRVIGYGDDLPWQDIHGVDNHHRVLAAGGFDAELAFPSLKGVAPPIALPERFVVLHPGNSHGDSSGVNLRGWFEERWRQLLLRLHEQGIAVVVTGTAQEQGLAAAVAGEQGIDLAGKTSLPQLVGVLEQASLFVASDTGPIHIAAAAGTPIIGLYGPTRPSQTRPYGRPGQVSLIQHDLPCSPCYGTPRLEQCQDNLCMKAIEVEEVVALVLQRLSPPVSGV